ncbi:zinc finger BED domain-containing protein RICESLEEPER 1-like [Salvia splendens]|uniref:zinc finger BED domain-containing protein RICESLEEPER 1-like n=1 Tax=Salvia splendens TaxID=180675 RepID=UPI001C26C993|nr:zinc finger BED domain-containing protein RICESLEEPER 1-like [Salvia splendens]XP_042008692.1 zinc finger BED domain-containing protein RICESLEEPER 1-like [Salvia splendens]
MEITEEEAVIVNSSRMKSVVWNDFDRVKKGETFGAICRHCKRTLSGSSTSGTSHLRNHLIRCRRRLNHDISQLLTRGKRKQTTLAVANLSYNQSAVRNEMVTVASANFEQGVEVRNMNVESLNLDQRRSQLDLARMIIMHGYPLGMVEDLGFKTFLQNLQPLFDFVTVNGIEADCIELYKREKQRVYEELDKLPGKVSLSADSWATNRGSDYLCLVAHFIDDSWEVKKKILDFFSVDPSEAEDMLSELIMTSLRNWDIDRKLFSLTIDNLGTYDKIVCRIRDQLCQHRFLMCEGQLFDVRCAASTVKLLVRDILETSLEITNKVRKTIQYIDGSRETQEKFSEIVQLVGINGQKWLSTDNPFQWNSMYVMLETALEYKEAFPQLQEHDPGFSMCPSGIDWDRLRGITSILKFFHEVSNVFVGHKLVTANSYFAEICDIHLQLIEWCHKSDDFISSLALKLKSKFDEYWKKCSLIMAIAAILDPRFKMKLVEYYYPQMYGDSAPDCIDIVSNCMKALYGGHASYSSLAAHGQNLSSESNGNVAKDRLSGFDRFLHETSASQNTKSDLDKYLEEPLFPRSADFSILNWWKVHEPRYPVLSMMARNILGIPISKVAPESLFDIGDRVLHHSWGAEKSDTLQALMCSQDWIQNEVEDPKTPVFALPVDAK